MESIRWRGEGGGCLRTLCGDNQVEGRGGVSEDTVWRQSGGGGERGGVCGHCVETIRWRGEGGGVSEDTVWSQSGGGGERGDTKPRTDLVIL